MAEHNELGQKGEDLATQYLVKKGYRIVERNWRLHGYEIDIIAEDKEFIVFVEVKTRSSLQWGNPEDFVDSTRQKRMVKAADFYLQMNFIDKPARFDIIGAIWNGLSMELDHIEDAFLAAPM
mgnify:CR=1 FL=1